MFKEQEKRVYVTVKNDESWRPKFYVNWKGYWLVSWLLKNIETEKKQITPNAWPNKWKEITVQNLVLDMVSQEWDFILQIPLYSGIARSILNSLSWSDSLDEIYLSIYNNKAGFRNISIRKSENKEDYYTPTYNWEQELGMIETKLEKWEEKKDYDKLTDKYITELLPKIKEKLWSKLEQNWVEEKYEDLPF